MKKNIVLIAIFIFNCSLFGQFKTTTISELKLTSFYKFGKYEKVHNTENGDSIYVVRLTFQNMSYSQIADPKTISFNNKESLKQFENDLSNAQKELGKKSKMSWDRDNYLLIYNEENPKYLILSRKNDNGYTLLTAKYVEKLINWIKTINFGLE